MTGLSAVAASELIHTRNGAITDTMANTLAIVALNLGTISLNLLLWASLAAVTELLAIDC